MKSFRLRVILWTIGIAGAVMLGFGVASIFTYDHFKLRQVDETLRLLGRKPVAPPHHERFWERIGPQGLDELERALNAESLIVIQGRLAESEENPEPQDLLLGWGSWESVFPEGEGLPEVEGELVAEEPEWRGRMEGPMRRLGMPMGGPEPFAPNEAIVRDFQILTLQSPLDGAKWRLAIARHNGFNYIQGVSLQGQRSDSAALRKSFAVAFPIALLVLATALWVFASRAMAPVHRLSRQIAGISAVNLSERISSAGSYQEFGTLITTFNGLLQRLEKSFVQATRFSADAAHELKTPLTILQGQLEAALQEADDGSVAQRKLAELLEEVFRLKTITRKLLILARADAGQLEVKTEALDLHGLASEVCSSIFEASEWPRVRISPEASDEIFRVQADPFLTRQVLTNLLGNIQKYASPQESTALLRFIREEKRVALTLENDCEALSPEQRATLFDRFTRIDSARNRGTDGFGLGLSLSLEFARTQGGDLLLEETGDPHRIRFRLELPLA